METEKNIKELLTICIPTYNRKGYLKHTLDQFLKSPFKDCDIFVLNNASTDGTDLLAEDYLSFPNIRFINNKYNIGGSANIIRCVEYGDSPYIWIIGDDDTYDFSFTEDVLNEIRKEEIPLIHVGAHTDKRWAFGGEYLTPRQALNKGYSYFKYGSFMGCSIYKRNVISRYIIEAYRNIYNSYPHMPILISIFENDQSFYISKNRIARASVGNQGYRFDEMIQWWSGTCNLLKSKNDRKLAFFNQFDGEILKLILSWKYEKNVISKASIKCVLSFLNAHERLSITLLYPPYYFYRKMRFLLGKRPTTN